MKILTKILRYLRSNILHSREKYVSQLDVLSDNTFDKVVLSKQL